jgi:hypothetical protein
MGLARKGSRIILLVVGRNIMLITTEGELLRDFEPDPTRDNQPRGLG